MEGFGWTLGPTLGVVVQLRLNGRRLALDGYMGGQPKGCSTGPQALGLGRYAGTVFAGTRSHAPDGAQRTDVITHTHTYGGTIHRT